MPAGQARFALVDEDDEVLCRARDVDGFFVPVTEDPPTSHTFALIGCARTDPVVRRRTPSRSNLGNVELRILADSSRPIGSYFLASAVVVDCASSALGEDFADVSLSVFRYGAPHPLAGEVWERWRHGEPATKGEWAGYGTPGREAWLEVVRLHAGAARTGSGKPDDPYRLDGRNITDRPGFYLALGEAINGPGGYFGANLDALADSLSGGFGATPPLDLVWTHFDVARGHLEAPYLDKIIEVLSDNGVRLEFA